jgi:PKHD-type hydroxylase
VRKLSISVQLSDCSEYEGGELEFQPRDVQDPNHTIACTEAQTKGSIIIFPSYVWHRVKPVTKGTRYSLVIWNLGRPYM